MVWFDVILLKSLLGSRMIPDESGSNNTRPADITVEKHEIEKYQYHSAAYIGLMRISHTLSEYRPHVIVYNSLEGNIIRASRISAGATTLLFAHDDPRAASMLGGVGRHVTYKLC